jgi:putative transposase
MANTYTQIHIQVVFTVQNRDCIIQETWKDELYKYISGIVKNHNHKVLAINGMPDHIHILIGMRPTQSLSDLMQDVKGDSSKWINQKRFTKGKFSWQEGFGAFSYGKSQVNQVIDYIKNQEELHKKWSFLKEYRALLEKFEVEFDQRYIFKEVMYDNE